MKNMHLLASILFFSTAPGAYAAVGCMDTSHYLHTKYDTKDLHYVHCDCACESSTLLRTWGKCMLCEHYHQPKDWVVLSHGKEILTVPQYRTVNRQDEMALSPATQSLIKTVVTHYKKSKR